MQGGCFCGSVRYEVRGTPVRTGICHCESCRRTASAPRLVYSTAACADLGITRGAPVEYRSSSDVIRSFRGTCGSPLLYRRLDSPDTIDVMTASLDHPELARPDFHLWAGEALGWDTIPADLPVHARSPRG